MKNFDEVEYIKTYNSTKRSGEAERSSREESHFQRIIPELKLISKEIDSYQRNSRKWRRKRLWKIPGLTYIFEGSTEHSKTLTAKILNSQSRFKIYKVDLAMIVNKFIGETEKNLDQLFEKAESNEWILFFDEADALFGKRTNISDSHDRFSNAETSYLLSRIERFEGVAILATNSKHQFDKAFSRRVRRVINLSLLKGDEEE
ncbi:MAG: ATP-binding protein [Candidatus Hodarchaeales archaeon]|jgi:SpoVK/Ycf46/Vps4 family AAA+-type ATPase